MPEGLPVASGGHASGTKLAPSRSRGVRNDLIPPEPPRGATRGGQADAAGRLGPPWLALESGSRRLVLAGYGTMADRVVLLTHDPATGALAIDDRFRRWARRFPGLGWPASRTGRCSARSSDAVWVGDRALVTVSFIGAELAPLGARAGKLPFRTRADPGALAASCALLRAFHRCPGVTRDLRADIRDIAANAPGVRTGSLDRTLRRATR
jgi:hypothetical protein